MKSDADLLELYRETGDRGALDELVARHYAAVHRAIARLVSSEDDARDLAQATFLRAIRSASEVRSPGKLRAWLLRIAVNEVRQWWRRGKLEPSLLGATDIAHASSREPVPVTAGRREFEQALESSLTHLPRELREPVVLRYYEELSLGEIAAVLDLPKSTVKARCDRGVDELRKRFRRTGAVALLPGLDALSTGGAPATATVPATRIRRLGTAAAATALLLAAALVVPGLVRGSAPPEPTVPVPGPDFAAAPETTAADDATAPASGNLPGDPAGGSRETVAETDGPGTLTGRVLALATEEPVDGVRIEVRPSWGYEHGWMGRDDPRFFRNVYSTNEKGEFRLTGLPVGLPVDLHLRRRGFGYTAKGDVQVPTVAGTRELGVIFLEAGRSLAGTVRNAEGQPVAGARVDAGDHRRSPAVVSPRFSHNGLFGASAVTDGAGRFRLEGLAPGAHRVEVRADGYATAARWPVGVPAEGEVPDLEVVLAPETVLRGRVRTEGGDAVAGATISVNLHEEVKVGTTAYSFSQYFGRLVTDADGRFTLTGLPDVEFQLALEIEHPGFRPRRIDDPDLGESPLEIVLARDDPEDGFPVSGVVLGPGGGPPPGPRGRVTISDGDREYEAEVAPGTGAFRFPSVPPGEWYVSTEVEGLRHGSLSITVDGPMEDVRIVHEPGVTLVGRITDSMTGRPVPGAVVTPMHGFPVTAGADGEYRLGGFPPDRTLLGGMEVSAEGYFAATPTLKLPAAGGQTRVDVALRPVAEGLVVRGRVVTEEGRPVLGASVSFEVRRIGSSVTWRSAVSSADGAFAFDPLDGAGLLWPTNLRVVQPRFAPKLVSLESGAACAAGLEIVLDAGRTVRGTVTDTAGDPVPGATVAALTAGSSRGRNEKDDPETTDWQLGYASRRGGAVADAGGRFHIDHLPRAALDLVATKAGYRWSGGGGRIGTAVAEGPEDVEDVVVLVRRGRVIEGRVRTPDGEPVANVGVRCFPGLLHVRTDAEGDFRLTGVFADRVKISITDEWHTGEVEVSSAASSMIELPAHRCGTVTGRAVGAAGLPKEDAQVTLVPASGEERHTSTDEHGRFRFSRVPLGKAEIRAGEAKRHFTVAHRKETGAGDLLVR